MWLADVKWKECSEYYELALAINPLYMNTWFSLGCAYMRIDEWDKALRAFSRVVSLDPDVLPRLSFLPTASLAKHSSLCHTATRSLGQHGVYLHQDKEEVPPRSFSKATQWH